MTVRYHERAEGLVPDYCCSAGRMEYRRPLCQVIAGASIDRAVGEHLVATMTPQAIELTMAVRAELQIRADEVDRLRLKQVERAQHEATLAQRRYMQTDPDNRLVATTLEADWNDKLRTLAQARDEAERQRAADRATLDEATEERIRALAEDFPAVWNDATTSDRNRKRMARLLIEDVTLLRSDQLHVHIRFKGGAVTSLELPLPENAWQGRLTHPDVTARVGQLLERHDEHETARRLNAEGLRTGAGRPFDADAVRWVRYTHGLETRQQRLHKTGMLTTSEMADRLGRPTATIRGWVREGRLRAERHGRKAIWLIAPLEEQPEEYQQLAARHAQAAGERPRCRDSTPPGLRARIEELVLAGHHDADMAGYLNDEGWRRPKGTRFDAISVSRTRRRCRVPTLWARLREEGMLTTPEMAVALGIGIKTVANWARVGRLRGNRCGKAPRARWLFEPLDAQPEPIRQRVAARATVKRHRGLLSDAAAGQGAI
jgi:excisionase family DNA binding protein